MLKTNVDFQHGYQVHIKSTFKSNVDLKYVLENVDLLCYYHLTKENANKCSFERGVSVKESRGQPKSDALKQVTCKGNF